MADNAALLLVLKFLTWPTNNMKRSRVLLLTVAVTVGLAAIIIAMRGEYARGLTAKHWERELDTVSDGRALGLVTRVAGLGKPGIPVVVTALGSRRESVARAAKRVLAEQIECWREMRAAESSPNVACLADALASRVDRFGPTAKADAAELAVTILGWPVDARVVDSVGVIASCEDVLRATTLYHRGRSDRTQNVALGGKRDRVQKSDEHKVARRWRLPSCDALAGLGEMPGGELPSNFPEGPLLQESRSAPMIVTNEPAKLGGKSGPPKRMENIRTTRTPKPHKIKMLSYVASDSVDLAQLEIEDLIRRLKTNVQYEKTAVRDELLRRGFNDVHFRLFEQLVDPNPSVRKRLARMMPGLKSVEPEPWLRWLMRDEDAGVRLVAITLLSTTGNPILLDEIETIARNDPDPRVRAQAEQLAKRRE